MAGFDRATDTYRPRLITKAAAAGAGAADGAIKDAKASDALSLVAGGKRADGRVATQLRPLCLKTGVVSQAHGSAYVELGACKVLCGVYGPRQSKKTAYSDRGAVWCDFKFAPFALEQRRRRGQDPDEKNHSTALIEALEASVVLERFPKSVVEAYVTVIEGDAGVLGAAITCASLALADAGIELYDVVAACTAAALSSSSGAGAGSGASAPATYVLDPSRAEELHASYTSGVLCALMPSLQQITHFVQTGQTDDTGMTQMMELCVDGCSKLSVLMRECLTASLHKKLSQRQIAPALAAAAAAATTNTAPAAAAAKKR